MAIIIKKKITGFTYWIENIKFIYTLPNTFIRNIMDRVSILYIK